MRLDQIEQCLLRTRGRQHFKSLARRAFLVAGIFAPLSILWGCSGVVSGQSTQPPPPSQQPYSISGTISPTAGGSGATVALSGAASATTTTNSSGNYTFNGLGNGTYAVSPSNAGYVFNPTSQTATISGANVTSINFTATAQQPHSVALSWNASTSTVVGYNVYRSTVSGGSYTRLNGTLVAGLGYTDSTVQNGVTYYYVATAVDGNGNESVFSNPPVSAVIP